MKRACYVLCCQVKGHIIFFLLGKGAYYVVCCQEKGHSILFVVRERGI